MLAAPTIAANLPMMLFVKTGTQTAQVGDVARATMMSVVDVVDVVVEAVEAVEVTDTLVVYPSM
jgi:hypothetical protein